MMNNNPNHNNHNSNIVNVKRVTRDQDVLDIVPMIVKMVVSAGQEKQQHHKRPQHQFREIALRIIKMVIIIVNVTVIILDYYVKYHMSIAGRRKEQDVIMVGNVLLMIGTI